MSAVLSHVRNNKDPLNQTRFHAQFAKGRSGGDLDGGVDKSILHVGLDWGASKTCLRASFAGSDELVIEECIPTVLGYAKDGMVDGILPNNATTLFGRDALTYRRHLHLAYPSIASAAARDFARHLRSRLDVPADTEIRAVIAAPSNLNSEIREEIRRAISRHFESVIFLPQPFLSAVGARDEARISDRNYVDPVRHSIFVDLGATATTLCVVQGYYPTADEQLTIDFGGNDFDELLRAGILAQHPGAELSPITLRLLKEKHAFAGRAAASINVDVIIAGQAQTLDLTEHFQTACDELLTRIAEGVRTLLVGIDCDDASELLHNILLTGGGCRIKNIAPQLERALAAQDLANPRVRIASEDYKSLAAEGALKAARQARDHHWIQVAR